VISHDLKVVSPPMSSWIYDIHNAWLLVLVSIAFVGFSGAGTLLMRARLLGFIRDHGGVNELIGSVLMCYGVFYCLLLGLIAVAAYQNYAAIDRTISQEAAQLTALYRDVTNYPAPERNELQEMLRDYARYVIEEAWPIQKQGLIDPGSGQRLGDFLAKLASFEPKTKGQEILHAETLRVFNSLSALRRRRVFSVASGIPTVMWYVVIVGAVLNILIVCILDMKVMTRVFLGSSLAIFIGLVIYLIAAMDHPYRGEIRLGPDAFQEVYQNLMKGKLGVPTTGTGSIH
jgi:hypothetical protein